ncbi:MAG: xanthine dehydrogenase accessory protein XdhC [Paracoccaceae bacterium]
MTAGPLASSRLAERLSAGAPTILIEIVSTSGSAPREPGAAMLASATEQAGTIGGGALEWLALGVAREMLRSGEAAREMDQPLGPELGQCCGGRMRLRLTRADASALARVAPPPPPAVLIFGAGHVGAATARALSALPVSLSVIDQRPALLAPLAALANTVETALPEAEVAAASPGAAFLVLTHDHGLDFLIAEAALARGDAAYVGMIGSATKRAVFVARLARAGEVSAATLICPIGAGGSRDKRPEIIAATTAAEIAAALF